MLPKSWHVFTGLSCNPARHLQECFTQQFTCGVVREGVVAKICL